MNAYFERNKLWINPFFGCMILAAGPLILSTFPISSPIPQWLTNVGLAVGGIAAGVGAMFTDTASARIVRFVGSAFGAAVILYSVTR